MNTHHFDEVALTELKNSLFTSAPVVITTHHKPDGDAMGSSLGLCRVLSRAGVSATVLSPSEFPAFLSWMHGADQVIDYIRHSEKGVSVLNNAGLILCLDFNDPRRVEKMQGALEKAQAPKVLIDHHLDPKIGFFKWAFSYPGIGSTCELIVHLLNQLGLDELIDREAAECFYAGIMTDTGSFRFNSVTSSTHQVVADLLKAGARNDFVHEMIYDTFSEWRLRFLGHMLSNCMEVLPRYNTVIFKATMKDMDRFHHESGDLEGIVNYGLSISGIRVAALFSERDGLVKISFRSKGDFSVKEIAEAHFDGGGHRNAAGGRSLSELDETIEKFKLILPQYLSDANES
jgi:phosphoesterase RecJ-like protein